MINDIRETSIQIEYSYKNSNSNHARHCDLLHKYLQLFYYLENIEAKQLLIQELIKIISDSNYISEESLSTEVLNVKYFLY